MRDLNEIIKRNDDAAEAEMNDINRIRGCCPAVQVDIVDLIMAYEADEMDEDQVDRLFQRLVNNGMAWTLQGHYGRTATRLIEAGRIMDMGVIG